MSPNRNKGLNSLDAIIDNLVLIPEGTITIGSTMEQVNSCVSFWAKKLVEKTYTLDNFKEWILKEFPAFEYNANSFYMSRFPITNGQYKLFIAKTNYETPESILLNNPDDNPVWGVTLQDAINYIKWLNHETKLEFRLPGECEWEYAAKGTENREYPFGNDFDSNMCNTLESGIGSTTPVDKYASYPSQFGICDLAGNVEEWTADTYKPYLGGRLIKDDLYNTIGQAYQIIKGGSYNRGGDLARCARRHGPFPSKEYKFIGFRIVADNL